MASCSLSGNLYVASNFVRRILVQDSCGFLILVFFLFVFFLFVFFTTSSSSVSILVGSIVSELVGSSVSILVVVSFRNWLAG